VQRLRPTNPVVRGVVLAVPAATLAIGTLLVRVQPGLAILVFPAVIGWSQLASP
jgi:hypothetical protein